jgi:hypothetical protein
MAIVNEPVPDSEETRDLLRELAAVSHQRHLLGPGTDEHDAAVEKEAVLRNRIWQRLVTSYGHQD